jgi:hypothetical protein
VRGPGAGALLSFYLGRLRYEADAGRPAGELLARPLLARYDLKEEDWSATRLSPVIDRQAGKREAISFWTTPGDEPPPGMTGPFCPEQLLERYVTLVFERALVKAQAGGSFLPELPKDD